MLIKEFRIVLPVTVDEYKIGQLWSTAETSKNETGGGDGVEVISNEPFANKPLLGQQFSSGQYTRKKYHLASKVSGFVRTILPKTALILEENAWNAYPYCKTVLTNEYMAANFFITIESYHLPGRGDLNNVHQLPPEKLNIREVVTIDIAAELENPKEYDPTTDPAKFKSKKTERGPLRPGWIKTAVDPVMTCYKLVTCEFKWFGFQDRAEKTIMRQELGIFTKFHRHLFCWIDNWHGLTMEDIRLIEKKTQQDLAAQRNTGSVRGHQLSD